MKPLCKYLTDQQFLSMGEMGREYYRNMEKTPKLCANLIEMLGKDGFLEMVMDEATRLDGMLEKLMEQGLDDAGAREIVRTNIYDL